MKIKILKGCDAFKQWGKNWKYNTDNKWEKTEEWMSSSVLTVMWAT